MSRWKMTLTCTNCGEKFQATRSDAKYCSPKCRKQMSLLGKQILKLHSSTLSNIEALLQYKDHPVFADDAVCALGDICTTADYNGEFTDSVRAAAGAKPGQPRPGRIGVTATESVPGEHDTASGAGAISESTGCDTSTTVQESVNLLKDDISSILDRLKWIEQSVDRLEHRVEESEEMIDWRVKS